MSAGALSQEIYHPCTILWSKIYSKYCASVHKDYFQNYGALYAQEPE
jgi:hypothetical protein